MSSFGIKGIQIEFFCLFGGVREFATGDEVKGWECNVKCVTSFPVVPKVRLDLDGDALDPTELRRRFWMAPPEAAEGWCGPENNFTNISVRST